MNLSLKNALKKRQERMEELLAIGEDVLFRKISTQSARKATEMLSEGSVYYSMGRYITEEELESMRKRLEILKEKNEQHPLGRPRYTS